MFRFQSSNANIVLYIMIGFDQKRAAILLYRNI